MRRSILAAALVLAGCAGDPPRRGPAADADRESAAGAAAYAAGDYRVAAARFSAAVDAARAVDDRGREARELHNRGLALLAAGAAEAAAADLAASLARSGDAAPDDRAATRLALARALAAAGKAHDALAAADQAAGEAHDAGLQARATAVAATLMLAGGDAAGAGARLAGRSEADPALDQARGLIALATGDRTVASAAFARVVEACRASGDLPGLAAGLEGMARAAEAAGDRSAAAAAWRRAAGVPYGGDAHRDACLAAAAALGEASSGSPPH